MRSQRIFLPLLLASATAMPMAATAQSAAGLDQRVTRVEKELRAVQRKVFPGGDAAMLEPEVTQQQAPPSQIGVPASSPVADLTARVDALEQELARLTAQSEQNGYATRQLQDAFDKYRAANDARIAAMGQGAIAPAGAGAPATSDAWPPAPAAAPPRQVHESDDGVADTNAVDPSGPPPRAAAAAPPSAAPIAAPSTGDPAGDAYMAGYNLWTAKRYPEAEAALQAAVHKYPNTRRASYAQNLLGRSYLDEGKPALAAKAFYKNYQDMPRGERAPDSLYYLGQSLVQLKKPAEACKVYAELDDVYGPTVKEPLKGRVAQGERDAGCKR